LLKAVRIVVTSLMLIGVPVLIAGHCTGCKVVKLSAKVMQALS
jgi:hypothetical protein